MGRFFDMDNPFFSFMGRIADLFLLNMLFLLSCVPAFAVFYVTTALKLPFLLCMALICLSTVLIGPAISALYYVSMKLIRKEESYLHKDFFHSFKQNLKQGAVIQLIIAVAAIILAWDIYIVRHMENPSNVLFVIFLIIAVILINIYIYVYPLQAKFFNSIRNTFQNALLMAIAHLPYTAVMFVVTLIPLFILLIPNARTQFLLIFIYLCIGPTLGIYAKSALFVKIFDKYIPKEEDAEKQPSEETDGTDGAAVAGDTDMIEAPDQTDASPEDQS